MVHLTMQMMESSLSDAGAFSDFFYYVPLKYMYMEDYAQPKWIYTYFINIIAL